MHDEAEEGTDWKREEAREGERRVGAGSVIRHLLVTLHFIQNVPL